MHRIISPERSCWFWDGEAGVRAVLLAPVAHLCCSLVGEGEGEDVFRFYAGLYEVYYFLGDDSCFAGTGAGEDELDAGAGDGFGPGGVEGH